MLYEQTPTELTETIHEALVTLQQVEHQLGGLGSSKQYDERDRLGKRVERLTKRIYDAVALLRIRADGAIDQS